MKSRRFSPTGARSARAAIPGHYLPWLLDTASLTQRLVCACAGAFQVQVLSQAWGRPRPAEARALGLPARERALVRQVRLLCDGCPWVYARTLLPRTTLTGPARRLAHLRSRSLGAVLFADPTMERGTTEIVRLRPTDDLFALVAAPLATPPAELWGRRTVFRLRGKPLLVSEFFLPGIAEFKP